MRRVKREARILEVHNETYPCFSEYSIRRRDVVPNGGIGTRKNYYCLEAETPVAATTNALTDNGTVPASKAALGSVLYEIPAQVAEIILLAFAP